VAAGATLLLSPLTSAYPASIERRPDGTLLVKARGEHFVFSERDDKLVRLLFAALEFVEVDQLSRK